MLDASDFRAMLDRNIARSGQQLISVFAAGDEPGFSYTIGNARLGLPELLIVGSFDPGVTGEILNILGARMRGDRRPLEGDLEFGAQFPARARRASAAAKSRFTIQASSYLRHDEYDVIQLLLCDPAGVYPGELGCAQRYDVPLS